MSRYLCIIVSIIFISCDNGNSPGGDCKSDVQSTYAMRYSWEQGWLYSSQCQETAHEDYYNCLDNGGDSQECFDQEDLDVKWCLYWLWKGANKLTLRECGVTIANITSSPDASDFAVEVNMEDSDGDGVPNYWEFWMGMNPCSQYSFGCGTPRDGTYDYDADGIPDGEDDAPLCNMGDDPGEYPSDCV